jgi:hypothetical protein
MQELAFPKTVHYKIKKAACAAQYAGAAGEGNEVKRLRDKAFTFLAEKVRVIRDYGQYVFRKEPDKLKRYRV